MKKFLLLFILALLVSCAEPQNDNGEGTNAQRDTAIAPNSPVSPTELPNAEEPVNANSTITRSDAIQIALDDAGLKESSVTRITSELDRDDGVLSYEIQFIANGVEYSYDIDAATGKILSKETEQN